MPGFPSSTGKAVALAYMYQFRGGIFDQWMGGTDYLIPWDDADERYADVITFDGITIRAVKIDMKNDPFHPSTIIENYTNDQEDKERFSISKLIVLPWFRFMSSFPFFF